MAHYGILTTEVKLDATLCFVCDDNETKKTVLNPDVGIYDDVARKKKVKANDDSEDDGESDEDEERDDDYADLWDSGDVGGFECKNIIIY